MRGTAITVSDGVSLPTGIFVEDQSDTRTVDFVLALQTCREFGLPGHPEDVLVEGPRHAGPSLSV